MKEIDDRSREFFYRFAYRFSFFFSFFFLIGCRSSFRKRNDFFLGLIRAKRTFLEKKNKGRNDDLLSFTQFSLVLLSFTQFYLVLPGFTGFYRVFFLVSFLISKRETNMKIRNDDFTEFYRVLFLVPFLISERETN